MSLKADGDFTAGVGNGVFAAESGTDISLVMVKEAAETGGRPRSWVADSEEDLTDGAGIVLVGESASSSPRESTAAAASGEIHPEGPVSGIVTSPGIRLETGLHAPIDSIVGIYLQRFLETIRELP